MAKITSILSDTRLRKKVDQAFHLHTVGYDR
jgi:hypothetical protein